MIRFLFALACAGCTVRGPMVQVASPDLPVTTQPVKAADVEFNFPESQPAVEVKLVFEKVELPEGPWVIVEPANISTKGTISGGWLIGACAATAIFFWVLPQPQRTRLFRRLFPCLTRL